MLYVLFGVVVLLLCFVKGTGPKGSIVKCYLEDDNAFFDSTGGRIVRPDSNGGRIDD